MRRFLTYFMKLEPNHKLEIFFYQVRVMTKVVEMDTRVSIFSQMNKDIGPVILINKFNVDPEESDEFMKAWAQEAKKFKEQPGFISTQLHRGIGGSCVFVNYAVWESTTHFKNAVNKIMNPEDRMSEYPPSTTASPHLFKKIAINGLCVE